MNEVIVLIRETAINLFGKFISWDAIVQWFLDLIPKLIGALLVFVVGWWLSGFIAKIILKAMERGKVDVGIRTFLHSCLKSVLKVIFFITALATLGMNVTTLVAAIGTAGVTLGLALKDSLSNFASGVIILFNNTFKVGDFIEVNEHTGTVKRIELMFTTLATVDNKRLVIPNSVMTSSMITNYTAKSVRRLDLSVGVAYGSDIAIVKRAINSALTASGHVHLDMDTKVGIASFDDSAITFDIKVWVDTDTYNDSRYEINEKILAALNHAGVEIPYNQLDVHMIDSNS